MKRIIPAILISAIVLSFAACSKKTDIGGGFDWPQ
jgi:predicted small lipoprotein YifL